MPRSLLKDTTSADPRRKERGLSRFERSRMRKRTGSERDAGRSGALELFVALAVDNGNISDSLFFLVVFGKALELLCGKVSIQNLRSHSRISRIQATRVQTMQETHPPLHPRPRRDAFVVP